MRNLLRLLVGVVLALGSSVAAGEFPALPEEQKVRLRQAFHLAEQLGPAVWPGFDGRQAPVLLIVEETEYLLNREQAPEGFAAVPGDAFNELPVFARRRTFAPNLQASFPAIGTETVVVGTAEQTKLSPTAWTVIVAHELFHVFQAAHGLNEKILALGIGPPGDPSWHLNFPFPYQDRDVQYAMHLLGYALYRTVILPNDEKTATVTYDARTAYEALSNLIHLLELRYRDPRQVNYLRYQTGKEGVARYVEYRLAERAAQDNYQPLPEFAAAEGFIPYAKLWEEKYSSQLLLIKNAGRVSRNRVEFYGLGHGLALTLNRVDPGWKARYFEPGVWLDDLLRAALDIPEPEATE